MLYNRELLIKALQHDIEGWNKTRDERAAEFQDKLDKIIQDGIEYTHGELADQLRGLLLKIESAPDEALVTREDLMDCFIEDGVANPWSRYKAASQSEIDALKKKISNEQERKVTGPGRAVVFLRSLDAEKVSDSGLEKAGFPGMKPGQMIANYLGEEQDNG